MKYIIITWFVILGKGVTEMKSERILRRKMSYDNDVLTSLKELESDICNNLVALRDLRRSLEERIRVVVCVYGDGDIEPLNVGSVSINDTGFEEIYAFLREQPEAEYFRPRDLKIVARVFKILENSQVPLEFSFEDDEVEEAFETFEMFRASR